MTELDDDIEERARSIKNELYQRLHGRTLTPTGKELLSAIEVNLHTLTEARKAENLTPAVPSFKAAQMEALKGLSRAVIEAEEILYGQARNEDHTSLANAATCLLPFLKDMADVSRARSYWDLCYGSGQRGDNS